MPKCKKCGHEYQRLIYNDGIKEKYRCYKCHEFNEYWIEDYHRMS